MKLILNTFNLLNSGVTDIEPRKKKISDLLIENKIITEDQLNEVTNIQKKTGKKLTNVLIENNYVTETQIMEVLEFQLGIPFICRFALCHHHIFTDFNHLFLKIFISFYHLLHFIYSSSCTLLVLVSRYIILL